MQHSLLIFSYFNFRKKPVMGMMDPPLGFRYVMLQYFKQNE